MRLHSPRAAGSWPSLRLHASACCVALLAFVAGACTKHEPIVELRIGATVPLSGRDADDGLAMKRGYERAVDEVNARGGLTLASQASTVRVVVDVRDDRADTRRSEELARALIDEGAVLLLGTSSPVRAVAQASVANRAECPYVVNAVDAPGLPGAHMEWVFSVAAEGDPEARAYAVAKEALAAIARAERPTRQAIQASLITAD